MDLREFLPPDHMQLRKFFLQNPELPQKLMDITALRRQKLIGQHRLQRRKRAPALVSQTFPRPGAGQSGHCADGSRRCLLYGFKTAAGTKTDLICLFLPVFSVGLATNDLLYFQGAASHLQIGQTVSLPVPADLVYTRAKIRRIFRLHHIAGQAIQNLPDALVF